MTRKGVEVCDGCLSGYCFSLSLDNGRARMNMVLGDWLRSDGLGSEEAAGRKNT